MSILRVLSQVLNKQQLSVWNELCEWDLSLATKYKSGLPKLRSCITEEIKKLQIERKERGQTYQPG